MRREIMDLVRVEYSLYPNFEHPLFVRPYPCQFSECEGDCAECPNKKFWKRARAATWDVTRREHAQLLREHADHMDQLAEKYGDVIDYGGIRKE